MQMGWGSPISGDCYELLKGEILPLRALVRSGESLGPNNVYARNHLKLPQTPRHERMNDFRLLLRSMCIITEILVSISHL